MTARQSRSHHPTDRQVTLPVSGVIWPHNGSLGLRLDAASSLPSALLRGSPDSAEVVPLTVRATIVSGGREVYGQPSRVNYLDVLEAQQFEACGEIKRTFDGTAETFVVSTIAGNWIVEWEYVFRSTNPRIALNISLTPTPDSAPTILRDVRVDIVVSPEDLERWHVEAPGNQVRPDITGDQLFSDVNVSPAGGASGSSGLVALHNPQLPMTVILWPLCRTEIGTCLVRRADDHFLLRLATGMAGRLQPGEWLRYKSIWLDCLDSTWPQTRHGIVSWLPGVGVHVPSDQADWIDGSSIYEVQIGYSVFAGDYEYAPYRTPTDLLADLGRIKSLGFDVLQIMPRQPYPSYNVHDYFDITTSYGDEAVLREIVDVCHGMGMHVILDIVLHGVVDQASIAHAAAGVRSSPYVERLAEPTTYTWRSTAAARDARTVAWSRHILDFEPHWLAGSPKRHRLLDEHPEWFMRDSNQNVIGVYSHAFDVANPSWQAYFSEAAEYLVRTLDIDGYRFDAPIYNKLPNWSTETQSRASYSPLGCLTLFAALRRRLKQLKPSVMFYTEPSGLLFRESMDVTYNYDEQWLPQSVLAPSAYDDGESRVSVRNGRELAAWFRDRNALLPAGSITAHHVDSHDSFWWPLPGEKWRREQFGTAATAALLAVFGLSGGVLMTFVGGEVGIEDSVRRVHELRSQRREIGHGVADYEAVDVQNDAVYAVARTAAGRCATVLVNLGNERVKTVCTIDRRRLGLGDAQIAVHDVWDAASVVDQFDVLLEPDAVRLTLEFEPYQVRVLAVDQPVDGSVDR